MLIHPLVCMYLTITMYGFIEYHYYILSKSENPSKKEKNFFLKISKIL